MKSNSSKDNKARQDAVIALARQIRAEHKGFRSFCSKVGNDGVFIKYCVGESIPQFVRKAYCDRGDLFDFCDCPYNQEITLKFASGKLAEAFMCAYLGLDMTVLKCVTAKLVSFSNLPKINQDDTRLYIYSYNIDFKDELMRIVALNGWGTVCRADSYITVDFKNKFLANYFRKRIYNAKRRQKATK